MPVTRIHGGVGVEGVINGVSGAQLGGNVKFFNIVVKEAGGSARDLRPEMASGKDGGLGLAVEAILRVCPPTIAYYVPNNNSGNIHLIVDGHNAPSASTGSATQPGLEEVIRALGTSVGSNNMDVSGTDVTEGAAFTVS